MFILLFCFSELFLIHAGDEATRNMQYDHALVMYQSALKETQNHAEILWRLSRLYILMADIKTDSSCIADYRQAEKYARLCLTADPANADGHAWLAASLGCRAYSESVRTKVQLAREIQTECLTAIRLNPRHDVAYSILGSFYHSLGKITFIERQLANLLLGGIPEGGFREGEAAFLKAISISPETFRHYYELGWLYYDWKQYDKARQIWTKALSLPTQMGYDSQRKTIIKQQLSVMTTLK